MIAFLASAEAGTEVVGGREADRGPLVVAAVTGAVRDAVLDGELHGAGLSPALVRGEGATFEVAVQGLGSFDLAPGYDAVPASPFLAIGGVVGDGVRLGFGAYGSFVPPLDGVDLGFGAGGRLGFALGSTAGGRWFGFEVDGGYGEVRGALFDGPVADPLWSRAGDEQPATDSVVAIRGAVEAVVGWDIDDTAVIYARLGGAGAMAHLGSPALQVRWNWTGIEPRATIGAGYRPDPRTLVSLGARTGIREPEAARAVPFTVALGLARRIGPKEDRASVVTAPVVAAAPAPVVVVPRVTVLRHPELACPEDTLSTGTPPPLGLEGWCVLVTPDGRVMRDGPYVRWSDPDHVVERGTYVDDQRDGLWVTFAPDGTPIAEGNYAGGLKDGPWKSWYPTGVPEADEVWLRGRETGVWRYYGSDGTVRVVGAWVNGLREGKWIDYAPDGLPVRERMYRDGRLMYEQLR